MAFHEKMTKHLRTFIADQKIFFVATGGMDGTINLSPKGQDTLRILDDHTLIWLNLTGSGNETSGHVKEVDRMTIMFCSFDAKPIILRLYCSAEEFIPDDQEWAQLICHFPNIPGSRNIFRCTTKRIQTSCGFAVPHYEFVSQRETLEKWTIDNGEQGIRDYWKEKNRLSIDGKPTRMH